MLVAHCVDHEIQRYANGVTGVFFGITIEIHEFPSVTQIRIVGDDDHESPIVVGYPVNSWVDIVGLLPSPATETPLSLIRSLDDFIDIEKAVKNWVRQGQWLHRIFGKHLLEFGLGIVLLIQSPEIV